MPFHALIFAIAPWVVPAAASAPRGISDIDPESSEALAEILASDALMQEPDASPADDGHWALHDLLLKDFAQTPTVARAVAAADVDNDELSFMRQPGWLESLEREELAARLRLVPAHQAREASTRVAFDIPIADHPLVDSYIDYFTGRGRWFFERWLARADRYIPMMQPILAKHGLPKDLVYVAMIESGFSPDAVSTARACGFWQFIVSTGRLYHLRTDVWVDERRDFVRATEAAADYLGNLYQEFGDWHLAWAGYNAGEGKVRRTMAKFGAHDFWTLAAQRGAFAKETQHYVPKIIAAAIVAKDRVKYGFPSAASQQPLTYDEIDVEDTTELGAVARKFGFGIDELRELNPALVYGVTPPGHKARLRVPAGRGAEVQAWLADLPQGERLSYAHHVVTAGDSVGRMARDYNTNMDVIRDFNHINNAKRLHVGQVLIIPVPPGRRVHADAILANNAPAAAGAGAGQQPTPVAEHPTARASRPTPTTPRTSPVAPAKPQAVTQQPTPTRTQVQPPPPSPTPSIAKVTKHMVARGETLWSISQRYGVTVAQVKSWNALRDNHVRAGEVLQVYPVTDVPKT